MVTSAVSGGTPSIASALGPANGWSVRLIPSYSVFASKALAKKREAASRSGTVKPTWSMPRVGLCADIESPFEGRCHSMLVIDSKLSQLEREDLLAKSILY